MQKLCDSQLKSKSKHLTFKKPKRNENLCLPKRPASTFMGVLFIIATSWIQPRCLSAREKINKLWDIYKWTTTPRCRGASYGVLHTMAEWRAHWPRDQSQTQKITYPVIALIESSGPGLMNPEVMTVVPSVAGGASLLGKGPSGTFWAAAKVLS